MTVEIPKTYDPKEIEKFWAEYWVKENLFAPASNSEKPPYVIVIPPPNVTGSLHMGHALNNTLQDVLIRWKKMRGFNALWVPGTDHGGIATQNVVEKILKQEKKSRYDLGREKFLERMWQWRKESGDTILMQLKRLGCSLDWTRTRFTMDATCSKAVLHAFVELFKKGWIYRGKRMVNWCVRCQTALSDIEVEYEERKDKLYYIRYPILSGGGAVPQGGHLIVATTRPETMLGDTAVAVHPDDARYEKIRGGWVHLPIVEKKIPVIADRAVEMKFGTGVVKVTPAHDPADFEMGERHNLEQVVILGFDGKMSSAAGNFSGLSREECRKKVLEELTQHNLIEKIEDYHHSVGTCYRCGVIVEPLISDQWFLKVEEMAKSAAMATQNEQVKIFPDSWTKPYLSWLENLKDWCISRQIWWGHRIPVWYCLHCDKDKIPAIGHSEGVASEGGNLPEVPMRILSTAEGFLMEGVTPIVNVSNPEVKPKKCQRCNGNDLLQDPDVLDTWFSSALWPFSVFGWPDQTQDLKNYYPTSVLVTGHEILYLWVARMVMFGQTFLNNIPFSHVFIHGIVRDKQGKKMSKSLGNVIDPLVMMEKYGTDALRFVLTSQSVPGRDMQISDDTFVGARNFANKIWNVSRFVLMHLSEKRGQRSEVRSQKESSLIPHPSSLELCDRWILSRLQSAIQKVNQSLEEYNLAQGSRILYQFVWSEFCDWYVELSKIRLLKKEPAAETETALSVATYVLDNILKLLHPVMPFLSEELWQNLQKILKQDQKRVLTILLSFYPKLDSKLMDPESELKMESLMEVIVAVRTIRSEMHVPPAKQISVFLNVHDAAALSTISTHAHYIRHLCKIEGLEIGSDFSKPDHSVSAVTGSAEIFVPLEGLIDFDKEKDRLKKELLACETEIQRIEARLSNPDFKKNAPQEEVSKAEERKRATVQKLNRLKEHLVSISSRNSS